MKINVYLVLEWTVKHKTHHMHITTMEGRLCLKVLCKCLNDLLEAEEKTRGIYVASDQDINVTNTTINIHFEVRKEPYNPDLIILSEIIQNCFERNKMKIKLGEIPVGRLQPR